MGALRDGGKLPCQFRCVLKGLATPLRLCARVRVCVHIIEGADMASFCARCMLKALQALLCVCWVWVSAWLSLCLCHCGCVCVWGGVWGCVCVWVSVYACVCAWLCVHGCKHRAVQHADHRSVVPARPKLHRRLPLPGRGGQRSQWEAV